MRADISRWRGCFRGAAFHTSPPNGLGSGGDQLEPVDVGCLGLVQRDPGSRCASLALQPHDANLHNRCCIAASSHAGLAVRVPFCWISYLVRRCKRRQSFITASIFSLCVPDFVTLASISSVVQSSIPVTRLDFIAVRSDCSVAHHRIHTFPYQLQHQHYHSLNQRSPASFIEN